MNRWIFIFLFSISLPTLAADTWDGEPEPTPTPAAHSLEGKVGIGFDTIPGASAGTEIIPGFSNPNALSIRYWTSDKLGWDFMLGGDINSQPGGTDAAGNPIDNVSGAFGLGIKSKYNWKQPTPWVRVQIVGRVSWALLDQDVTNPVLGTIDTTTTTFNLFTGLGFEAFIPKWEAVSIEAATGLSLSSIQTRNQDGVVQSGSALSIIGDGFTPINLGLHVYF